MLDGDPRMNTKTDTANQRAAADALDDHSRDILRVWRLAKARIKPREPRRRRRPHTSVLMQGAALLLVPDRSALRASSLQSP